jgi:hypothetical protein
MKKIGLLSVIFVALVGLAGSASAKVEVTATKAVISGPGEDIRLDAGQAQTILQRTDMVARLYGETGTGTEPSGALGPRYTITYTLSLVDHARPGKTIAATVQQHLYPFAEGGPRLQTPEGQSVDIAPVPGSTGEIPTGWMQVDAVTMDHLEVYGLPTSSEVAESVTVADPNRWPLFATGLVLLATMTVVTWRMLRTRLGGSFSRVRV